MNQTTTPSAASRIRQVLVTIACLTAVAAVLWQLLPKGSFSSDLTQVGQGKPALVMLREIHVMGGEQVVEHMLAIHAEFADDMVFLVVHTGHPDGQQFAQQHNIGDGSLVLFDAAGTVVQRMGRPTGSAELRQFIRSNLGT